MFSAYPLIPVHYIAQINEYLESKGIVTDRWLASADLTKTDIIEDVAMLTYPIYQNLILTAVKLDGEEDIGLKLGANLSLTSHGALGFALFNCASIREVLKLFGRYLTTRTPLLGQQLTDHGGTLELELVELYDITPIRRCFLEAVVVTVANILRSMLPQSDVLLAARFPYSAPAYADDYVGTLNCQISFDNPCTSLVLNSRLIDQALPKTDQHSLYQAKVFCEQELQKVNQLQSLSSQIRLLLMNSREQFLTLQQISDKLNMTGRTLHRRLGKENTSFQMILEDVRHTLAKQYLVHHKLSVKQIAFLLGYADVANFRRAFKRWQGESPSQYRTSNN